MAANKSRRRLGEEARQPLGLMYLISEGGAHGAVGATKQHAEVTPSFGGFARRVASTSGGAGVGGGNQPKDVRPAKQ